MPVLRRLLAACLAAALLAPATALGAAPRPEPLETVMQDDAQVLHRPPEQVRASLERMRGLGVDRVRVTANWSVLTRGASLEERPDFDASDPAAYEQARWGDLDRAVLTAAEIGMPVMIDIAFFAPRWASNDPPGERGRTDIDPAQYAAFATAVARRYTGSFTPPADTEPVEPSEDELLLDEVLGGTPAGEPTPPQPVGRALPRVDIFTLWNEPNHTGFLRPQWVRDGKRWRPRSPEIYREMVERAYPAIKAVVPDARVLVGATARSGAYQDKGTGGVPPLRFLRELACVDRQMKPLRTESCRAFKGPIPGDGWSHHPYFMTATPDSRSRPKQVDDAPMADMPRLVRALDRLADAGRIAPALREVWVTEYGYETNPPSSISRFDAADQAHFLPWGEFLAWRIPEIRSFAQFLLRDLPPGTERVGSSRLRPYGEWFSGLEYADGRPKLASEAFRAGLFVQRLRGGRRLRVWGRLRLGAGPRRVAVEVLPRPGAAWQPVATRPREGGGAAPVELAVEGRSVLDRRAPARWPRRAVFRLRYQDGDTVRYSEPVRATRRMGTGPAGPKAR